MKEIIYLDNAATTKPRKEVVAVVEKAMLENYGNASSAHALGEKAFEVLKKAKEEIAKEINCKPHEIYFTSGGTEADNTAILGIVEANQDKKKNKVIISSIEHAAVYEPCMILKRRGYNVVEMSTNKEGMVDMNELEKEIDKKTIIVSIMHVNNEIGSVQNLERIGELCKSKGAIFHSDCVQSFRKLKIDVKKYNLNAISASGHKIHGPKGIGFIYLKEGTNIKPLIYGGGQEKGLRSGTENIPSVAGFSRAIELMKKTRTERIRKLKNKLANGLKELGAKINSNLDENGIYNLLSVSFPELDADNLVIFLSNEGIMCSTGSACSEKSKEQSRTLKSIGLTDKESRGTIRFSLSEENNEKEIDKVINKIRLGLQKEKIIDGIR